jgi:hypothetical protein
VTSGDIDVSKSKWSTMRWHHCKKWGIAKLETKKDFPGEVGMRDVVAGQTTSKTLERLELDEADRVLGLRLPMNGTMDKEFKFRCHQIRTFSKQVYLAPLTHRDAWLFYESRYRSKI